MLGTLERNCNFNSVVKVKKIQAFCSHIIVETHTKLIVTLSDECH